MIIGNKSYEFGDVLEIHTDTPLIGLVALSSFVDVTVNENATKLFSKTFRYSVDGITWSPFVALTNDNLAGVVVNTTDTFYAEYRYERIGTDLTGYLEFDSVTLNGEFITQTDGPAYLASNFTNYFNLNNICSIAWSVNVLEKLYKKGIIPKYMERDLTGDNSNDRDFIDLWRAVTHYFALYVCLARQFQFFYQNRDLLLEYIKQRGLFVCDDISYIDLMYLMEFYYDEIRQRGTRQIFEPKADDITIVDSKQVDGEYLRMICFDKRDEFIRNLNRNKHIGWNVRNSSPTYKGLIDRLNTNKYYIDFIDDITDIQNDLSVTDTSLPYISLFDPSLSSSISSSNSSSTSGGDLEDDVIIISPPNTTDIEAGIGGGNRRIVVNPNLSYQITFKVKVETDTTPKLTFGVNCYDKDDNIVNIQRAINLGFTDRFFQSYELNQADKFYFVRGIIFNKKMFREYDPLQSYLTSTIIKYTGTYYRAKRNVPIDGESTELGIVTSIPATILSSSPILWDFWEEITVQELQFMFDLNIGSGFNLVFVDDVVKIDPLIIYENSGESDKNMFIYDIRVQPLNTPYSKGFIQTSNILELWNTKNNLSLSEEKVNKDIKHFLIPYNVVLKNNFIPTEINREI